MRRFNVAGLCVTSKHYMVDISGKIDKIMELIDYGDYFTINRARQYGKTTTLNLLEKRLEVDFICASISFEGLGDRDFESAEAFCPRFLRLISRAVGLTSAPGDYAEGWINDDATEFVPLGDHITKMCKDRKVVLMIDEVDRTSDNRVFLHMLGMLRAKYLAAQAGKDHTFHSVILAGVYDIKNTKLKMINEGSYAPTASEGGIYNSPWNIAVDFEVDMSFNPAEISTMLNDYEADHHTGMNITQIADGIHFFTNGYPFLVSRICKHIDEKLDREWSYGGIQSAVKILLAENNTLFDDISKNLNNSKELYDFMYSVLINGEAVNYVAGDPLIDLGAIYGLLMNVDGKAVVSNKIFEIRMTDYYISVESRNSRKKKIDRVVQYDVVKDGRLDMELCLRKFAEHYAELFTERDSEFLEKHGKLLFLIYLKPLINGQGFYHLESQLADLRRMDIVVDFGSDQFIVELKLWRGESGHEDALEQLLGYMDSKNASAGYLLTFDLRKNERRQPGAKWLAYGDKRVFDVIV